MGQQTGMKIRCVGGPRDGYKTTVPFRLIDLLPPVDEEPIVEPFQFSVVAYVPRNHAYRAMFSGGELVHVDGVVLFDYC